MTRTLLKIALIKGLIIGIALGVLITIFLTGMRSKSPRVIHTVRRFNHAVTNPRILRTAGGEGSSADLIEHVGRRSGTTYATPVGAVATDDGFAIGLPYGEHSDWMKNVLASGSATLTKDGVAYSLDRPEVVPTSEMLEHFGPNDQRAFRAFKVDNVLRLRHAE